MNIAYGTDSYGRVKTIAGTSIVTRFAMLQHLPLYPLESYYKFGAESTTTTGIPLFAGSETTTTQGVSLVRLDTQSVIMAYVRALFIALLVPGSFAAVFLIILWNENPKLLKPVETFVVSMTVAIASIGLISSYKLPMTPNRERHIRTCCAELLDIGIDPARVTRESSALIEGIARQQHGSSTDQRTRVLLGLIVVRAKIAQHLDIDRMEAKTDELLAYLTGE